MPAPTRIIKRNALTKPIIGLYQSVSGGNKKKEEALTSRSMPYTLSLNVYLGRHHKHGGGDYCGGIRQGGEHPRHPGQLQQILKLINDLSKAMAMTRRYCMTTGAGIFIYGKIALSVPFANVSSYAVKYKKRPYLIDITCISR